MGLPSLVAYHRAASVGRNSVRPIGGVPVTRHVLVVADSLAFHGPAQPEVPGDPRLWPNVMAAALAAASDAAVEAHLVARPGWTSRDAWWALTKDPNIWGAELPRADAVVFGVGGMDQLPAAVPTYLREGIAFVRPGPLRRQIRQRYLAAAPHVMRATGGPFRQLPQSATDRYLSRCVEAVRYVRPTAPLAVLGPAPFRAAAYPALHGHAAAVHAARRWAIATNVALVEPSRHILPTFRDGSCNPDGMHWAWSVHDAVGRDFAAALLAQGFAAGD